jgi:hypothetical protein
MGIDVDKDAADHPPDVRSAANRSLIHRACNRDTDAITTMFRQFIPSDEGVAVVEYLGSPGVVFKSRSFACVTDRRVASLIVKRLGQIIYQDGVLESLNSAVLYQPSRISGFFLINRRTNRKKVGLVLSIGEGISVHILSHRKEVRRANVIYRAAIRMRERRLSENPSALTYAAH